jgi:hypothetical protein
MRRRLTRLQEASDGAADIVRNRHPRAGEPETSDERDQRLADEAELTRELGE